MLGDKNKYIEHIDDQEQHIVMRKIIDKAESVLKYHETAHTDFLDPYQRELAISILNRLDISYYGEGGLEDAERKSIIMFPEYMTKETIEENPIKAIKIDGSFKFNSVNHRDFLGAIMGLGIKREVVGDIFVHEDFATVILHGEILDFVMYNLKQIGKESVEIKEIDLAEVEKPIEDYTDVNLTISSLRLDVLISGICKMSRSKASILVNQSKVKVNWKVIDNVSFEINEGDMLSIRQFGRIKLVECLGHSKKGKERIRVRVYK